MFNFSDNTVLRFFKCNFTPKSNSCRNFVDIIYNYQEGPIKKLAK